MRPGATGVTGILYDVGLGSRQLAAQIIGPAVICTVIFGVAYTFFKVQNSLTRGGIRSDELDEIVGLDLPEMGALAYPEFHLHPGEITGDGGGSPTIGERPAGHATIDARETTSVD